MTNPQMGWLDRIVGVQWGSGWLALGVTAGGAGPTIPSCTVSANGVNLANLFSGASSALLRTSPVFKENAGGIITQVITFTNVEADFSDGWHPTINFIRLITQTPNPLTLPAASGTWNGVGSIETGWVEAGPPSITGTDVADCIVNLHAAFGSTTQALRAGAETGPFNHTIDTRFWSAHVVAWLNLSKLRAQVKNNIVTLTVKVGSGDEHVEAYTFKKDPSGIPLDPQDTAPPEYAATCESSSIKNGGTSLTFTVDATALTVS